MANPELSPQQSFAEMLREFRVRAGLSQHELAERSRLSARTISDIERGVRRKAYRPTVEALTAALGLASHEARSFASSVRRTRQRPWSRSGNVAPDASGLPVPLTSFVGRSSEVATLAGMVLGGERRLITLTGAPGVGKSRLALEVARELRGRHGVPAAYVNLAGNRKAGGFHAAVNAALDSLEEAVAGAGQRGPGLLVIDDLERLPAGDGGLAHLLSSSPWLRILGTSRAPVELRGEQVFVVEPLAMPDPAEPIDAATLDSWPAVRLLLERIAEHAPAVRVTAANAPAIAAISRKLDGLPLAIELAATHGWLLGLEALDRMLERPLDLWPAGTPPARGRRGPLRRTIAQTYSLLASEDRWAFRRLSALRGEWTLDDAVDLLSTLPPRRLARLAPRLAHGMLHRVAQHGLIQRGQSDRSVRFHMLGVIHDYASTLMDSLGENEGARTALVQCALRMSEDALAGMGGTDDAIWRAILAHRTATFDTALQYAFEADDVDTAAVLLWNLRHLIASGFFDDAGRWVEQALAGRVTSPGGQGKLLVLAACLSAQGSRAKEAWPAAHRGLILLANHAAGRLEALQLLPASLRALVQEGERTQGSIGGVSSSPP